MNSPKLFITYSHEDAAHKERLEQALAEMVQNGEIEIWSDAQMLAGDAWEKEIKKGVEKSDIFIYLVSAASLASKNCNTQLTDALSGKSNIVIIPVILEDCDFLHYPLAQFSTLPVKNNDIMPLSRWKSQDEAWKNVVDGIRKTLNAAKSNVSYNKAYYFIMKDDYESAIAEYARAIEINPKDVNAHNNLGNIYIEKGDYESAIAEYARAIEINPEYALAHNNRGIVKMKTQDYKGAKDDFRAALMLIGKTGNEERIKRVQEAITITEEKQFAEKLEKIKEKIGKDPYIFRGESKKHEKICSKLYRSYEMICKNTRGLGKDFFKKMLNSKFGIMQELILDDVREYIDFENDADVLAELQHYQGNTNLIDFSRDYLVALFFACDGESNKNKEGRLIFFPKTSPGVKSPKKNLNNRVIFQSSVFVERDDGYIPDEECEIISIPADIKETVLGCLKLHHNINAETIYGDLQGYVEHQAAYQQSYVYFQRGRNYVEKEQYKEAVWAYGESIRLKSNFSFAYNNRGYAKDADEDYEGAIADYTRAIEINPDFADAYNNRGITYHNMGDFVKAIADYDGAIELNPNFADAYSNRGMTYYKIGDLEKVTADVSKAIALAEAEEGDEERQTRFGIARKVLKDLQSSRK